MKAVEFIDFLEHVLEIDFYSGVPDSLLNSFISELIGKYGISNKHIIAANEGNAVALAAGYYLATKKTACVYMQNSGQGNMVNPYTSLLAPDVYNIPCVFVIGWRGQPGTKDEPQHIFQGQITTKLMDLLKIEYVVLTKEDTIDSIRIKSRTVEKTLKSGNSIAFIIEKDTLTNQTKQSYCNSFDMKREDAIREIVNIAGEDTIVCTTGKASRELFEIREKRGQSHKSDFLTVGSMGHSSSIALGLALCNKHKLIWCIDGDGAMLMYMGAMAIIGAMAPCNYIHVVINNEAHETVGGMPTVAGNIDLLQIASGCGYKKILQTSSLEKVSLLAKEAKAATCLTFIEIKAALGCRSDLSRPYKTVEENKRLFMEYFKEG